MSYTWFNINSASDPFADTTMGIPGDIETFILWQKSGRYRNSRISGLKVKAYTIKRTGVEHDV